MEKRVSRIKGQGLSAGVDSWPPKIPNNLLLFIIYYWYMWKDNNISSQKKNTVNVNFISFNYTMNISLHILVESILPLLLK